MVGELFDAVMLERVVVAVIKPATPSTERMQRLPKLAKLPVRLGGSQITTVFK